MPPAPQTSTTDPQATRCVVIGPVLPFRGGIAQHTTMLARALADTCDLSIFSFSRLYPKILFPGESDRDPDYEGHQEPHCSYTLDSINPFTWMRTVRRVRALQPDLVIIPWWTFFLGPSFWFIARALRREGIETVFFVHNASDHEEAAWKRWLSRHTLNNGARYVVHTRQEAELLSQMQPGKPVAVHPHPIYSQFPYVPDTPPRQAALELLFFGFIRPYKGLEVLLQAMQQLQDLDIHLTVAGECWGDPSEILKQAEAAGRTETLLRYLDDRETASLFQRADVVVLPYLSATGSGVIPLAYHYDKPVIATRVGGLPDVVIDSRTGWLVEPGDVEALAHCIKQLPATDLTVMPQHIQALKDQLSWNSLADSVVSGRSLSILNSAKNDPGRSS